MAKLRFCNPVIRVRFLDEAQMNNNYGICVYKDCDEIGILKLKEKPVCQDHFFIAMKAIGDKMKPQKVRKLEQKLK